MSEDDSSQSTNSRWDKAARGFYRTFDYVAVPFRFGAGAWRMGRCQLWSNAARLKPYFLIRYQIETGGKSGEKKVARSVLPEEALLIAVKYSQVLRNRASRFAMRQDSFETYWRRATGTAFSKDAFEKLVYQNSRSKINAAMRVIQHNLEMAARRQGELLAKANANPSSFFANMRARIILFDEKQVMRLSQLAEHVGSSLDWGGNRRRVIRNENLTAKPEVVFAKPEDLSERGARIREKIAEYAKRYDNSADRNSFYAGLGRAEGFGVHGAHSRFIEHHAMVMRQSILANEIRREDSDAIGLRADLGDAIAAELWDKRVRIVGEIPPQHVSPLTRVEDIAQDRWEKRLEANDFVPPICFVAKPDGSPPGVVAWWQDLEAVAGERWTARQENPDRVAAIKKDDRPHVSRWNESISPSASFHGATAQSPIRENDKGWVGKRSHVSKELASAAGIESASETVRPARTGREARRHPKRTAEPEWTPEQIANEVKRILEEQKRNTRVDSDAGVIAADAKETDNTRQQPRSTVRPLMQPSASPWRDSSSAPPRSFPESPADMDLSRGDGDQTQPDPADLSDGPSSDVEPAGQPTIEPTTEPRGPSGPDLGA